MERSAKILICHNEPVSIYENYMGKEIDSAAKDTDTSETAFFEQIALLQAALSTHFDDVRTLSITRNVSKACDALRDLSPDIIFNFVETVDGHSEYEHTIAGIFELMGIPYTGNTALCLGTCLDKGLAKAVLRGSGVKTPRFSVARIDRVFDERDVNLEFPLIVKPVAEDSSIGISELSVVRDARSLKSRVAFLFESYRQDVLVEEYIDGREFNAAILGDEVLPLSECTFDTLPEHLPAIVTYEAKWNPTSAYFEHSVAKCPTEVSEEAASKIRAAALAAYHAMGCRDYARVDIRLSPAEEAYVIEVNPNPDLSADAGFLRTSKVAGISCEELLLRLAEFAWGRRGRDGGRA